MFRISNDVRSTQTQDGSILLDIHHGQMFCLNLVGSKILELLERGDVACVAEILLEGAAIRPRPWTESPSQRDRGIARIL
jgi:hypothetical protein